MQTGDNVLINYNTLSNLQKVATFIESNNDGILLQDISGKFILTHEFINRKGITVTLIEE